MEEGGVVIPVLLVLHPKNGIVILKQHVKQQEEIGVVITVLIMNVQPVLKINGGTVMMKQVVKVLGMNGVAM